MQIGGALGSWVGLGLGVSAREKRILLVAGVAAGILGFATTIISAEAGAAYVDGKVQDADGVIASLNGHVPQLVAFHVVATLTVLALVPFGVGLHRRLRASLGTDSLVPGVAAFGILGSTRRVRLYLALSVVTAVCSLGIGTLFILDRSDLLPVLFSG